MTDRRPESLPSSWAYVTISDVTAVNPRLNKSNLSDDLEVSFVPMPAVEELTGRVNLSQFRRFADVKKGYTPFQEGDVLFAKITPCMENGKIIVVPALRNGHGFGSTEFHVLRPHKGINPKYLYYFVSSQRFRRDAEHNMTGAVGQRRVPVAYLSERWIPVAPSLEQNRVVAKLEEMFSELDNGIEALRATREQLRAYRHSLLRYAFEGKLTSDWRARRGAKLYEARDLEANLRVDQLAQHAEEMAWWRAAIEKWEQRGRQGRQPVKPAFVGATTVLSDAETRHMNQLPHGWAYFKVASICSVVRGGSPRPAGDPKYYGGSIPFLKVADLTRTSGMRLSTHTFTITEAGLSKTRVTPPETLLISNSGATLGVPKICTFETTFNDGIAAFLGLPRPYLEYFYYFWESKTLALRAVDQGAAQPNLNTTILGDMPVPICDKSEALEVVNRLESLLSNAEQLVTDIDARLEQASSLREAILARAFSAQLGTTDSMDQPASELLERIRTEGAGQTRKKEHSEKNGKKEAA